MSKPSSSAIWASSTISRSICWIFSVRWAIGRSRSRSSGEAGTTGLRCSMNFIYVLPAESADAFYGFVASDEKITDYSQKRLGFFLLRKMAGALNYGKARPTNMSGEDARMIGRCELIQFTPYNQGLGRNILEGG